MRYAILADIHANLEAFSSVLKDIERRGEVAGMWCLGDTVGYGPDPVQCIELLRRREHICIAGNHDLATIGQLDLSSFNPDAAAAIRWTAKQLTPEDIQYLGGLPTMIKKEDFTLVHGSPREPVWEYLQSLSAARENFTYFKSPFCLVGHSHVPQLFKQAEDGTCSFTPLSTSIGQVLGRGRMIINPGGVGQPRDGDPRASYAIYDSEAGMLRLYRVPYDINATQQKMMKHNLPVRLAIRLGQGI